MYNTWWKEPLFIGQVHVICKINKRQDDNSKTARKEEPRVAWVTLGRPGGEITSNGGRDMDCNRQQDNCAWCIVDQFTIALQPPNL